MFDKIIGFINTNNKSLITYRYEVAFYVRQNIALSKSGSFLSEENLSASNTPEKSEVAGINRVFRYYRLKIAIYRDFKISKLQNLSFYHNCQSFIRVQYIETSICFSQPLNAARIRKIVATMAFQTSYYKK